MIPLRPKILRTNYLHNICHLTLEKPINNYPHVPRHRWWDHPKMKVRTLQMTSHLFTRTQQVQVLLGLVLVSRGIGPQWECRPVPQHLTPLLSADFPPIHTRTTKHHSPISHRYSLPNLYPDTPLPLLSLLLPTTEIYPLPRPVFHHHSQPLRCRIRRTSLTHSPNLTRFGDLAVLLTAANRLACSLRANNILFHNPGYPLSKQ